MRRTLALLVLVTLLLTSCSNPRIDTSSENALKSSIEKVRQSLPQNKKEEFDRAFQIILFSQMKDLYTQKILIPIDLEQKVIEVVNEKTGLEVIAIAKNIQKKDILQEIKKLEANKASAENDKLQLAKFRVVRSRFYKQKQQYYEEEKLIIELTMKNGTTHPVSTGYFIGTLTQPNRAVPWLRESFSYSIPGGLEPEEEIHLRLVPSFSSQSRTIDVPQDAVFTVEVKQLNGANSEPLFSECKFTQEDEEKLKELKESLRHEQVLTSELYVDNALFSQDRCQVGYDYPYSNGLDVYLLP